MAQYKQLWQQRFVGGCFVWGVLLFFLISLRHCTFSVLCFYTYICTWLSVQAPGLSGARSSSFLAFVFTATSTATPACRPCPFCAGSTCVRPSSSSPADGGKCSAAGSPQHSLQPGRRSHSAEILRQLTSRGTGTPAGTRPRVWSASDLVRTTQ